MLTIGDSFTDGADFLRPLRDSLIAAGQKPKVSFVGTQNSGGMNHEGRGGRTAAGYLNLNSKWYKNSIFLNGNTIDFPNYFTNKLKTIPNIIIVELGVNDTVSATKNQKYGITVASKIEHLALLVKKINEALPSAKVLVMMPTPPSRDPTKMVGYDRALYREKLHEFWKLFFIKFENKEMQNIFVVPGYVDIDLRNNFRDFLHPSVAGYTQLSDALMGDVLWAAAKDKSVVLSQENN